MQVEFEAKVPVFDFHLNDSSEGTLTLTLTNLPGETLANIYTILKIGKTTDQKVSITIREGKGEK